MKKKNNNRLLADLDDLALIRTLCAIVQVVLVGMMLLHVFGVV